MGHVRCEICRSRLPTCKRLISHYINCHSKFKLARALLKLSITNIVPKVLHKKTKTDDSSKTKTESVFENDNIQILCKNNEIIIRHDKSLVDMELSFDENPHAHEVKQEVSDGAWKCVSDQNNNKRTKFSELRKHLKFNTSNMPALSTSSSSASSEDSTKKFCFKRRIRKKRDCTKDKDKQYKINITRLPNEESLNETTGKFYFCHCKHESTDGTKLASDTESASDTGRTSDPKVFCSRCGNGYREESLLREHMKIHETHCRVCNEIFPTERQFKEHIQSHFFKVYACHICSYEFPLKPMLHQHFETHVEDSILESVVDMEEEYHVNPCPIPNISYQESINSILRYLSNNRERFFGSNMPKIYCDICLTEVYYGDYRSHMQNVHFIYGYS